MTVNLSYFAGAGWQFFTNDGVPLRGGYLYTYQAGTTTPLTTYTTSAGNIANANPIQLNAAGRLDNEIWLTSGLTYKFVLKDDTNATIGTYDNIPGVNDIGSILTDLANTTDINKGDALVGFRQASNTALAAGAVGRTVHQKFTEMVSVKDFGAVGDGTTDDTEAIRAAINFGMQSQNNGAGFGSNNGRTIFFPIGKYRICDAIGIYFGCNLMGEQSGLTNSGNTISTGTVLLLSNTKGDGSPWTSTTVVGGNTINKRVMFSMIDGGPIEMQNLGAITEANNSADSVFLLSNNGFNVPYENIGVTQALFRGMRIFAFGEVFRGCRFEDVTIDNCGLEYNINVFSVVPKYGSNQGRFAGINSIATQYFSNYQTVAVSNYTSFADNTFSSCIFFGGNNSNGSIFNGSGTTNCDFSNNHFSACDFQPDTNNTGGIFALLANGFIIQTNTFTSCRIKDMPLTFGGYQPPSSDQFLGNVFTGNVFEGCNVNLNNNENDANVFVGNTFKGASYISHYGGTLTFVGNSFDLATNSGNDFIVQDTAGLLCVGNYFRANKQSINYTTTIVYKISGNVNLQSNISTAYVTVTAGGGGWSNSSPTPQAIVDESGFVYYTGLVVNSGVPALDSIMCTAPSGMTPKYNTYCVLPASNASSDYAIAVFSTDGNLYFKAQTGTAQSFSLSPIVYQAG